MELNKQEEQNLELISDLITAQPYLQGVIRHCDMLSHKLGFVDRSRSTILSRLYDDVVNLRVTARAALRNLEECYGDDLPNFTNTDSRSPIKVPREDKYKDKRKSRAGGKSRPTSNNGD